MSTDPTDCLACGRPSDDCECGNCLACGEPTECCMCDLAGDEDDCDENREWCYHDRLPRLCVDDLCRGSGECIYTPRPMEVTDATD